MARHRSHSVDFKRHVAQAYAASETLYGLARRHDIFRDLVSGCVEKYKAGASDKDADAAYLLQIYEARIAALERLVVKQALEFEFLKGALRSRATRSSGPTSVITGPAVSPSSKAFDCH